MRSSIIVFALATTTIPHAALGASTAETIDQDTPIVIEGHRSSYGAKSTTTATKTDTQVRDIPQAMTVITKAQIEVDGSPLPTTYELRSDGWMVQEIGRAHV